MWNGCIVGERRDMRRAELSQIENEISNSI